MQIFNSKQFNETVKNIKEEVVNVIRHSQAKYLICQAGKDNDYAVEDIYFYLRDILQKNYPNYMDSFNSREWVPIYTHYIKENDELADGLQTVLDGMGKRKDNDLLRDKFFSTISGLGINPEVMKIDMSIDYFGWVETLDLILDLAQSDDFTETVLAETTSVTTVEEIPTMTKRSRRTATEILQCSLDGEFIRSWKSISEICAAHPDFCRSSISKCLSGTYKTAEKYIWKRAVDEKETISSTVAPSDLEEKSKNSHNSVTKMIVAYYLDKNKKMDKSRHPIGTFCSQKEAADKLGVHTATISNYFRGIKKGVCWTDEKGEKFWIGFEKEFCPTSDTLDVVSNSMTYNSKSAA